MPSVVAGVFQFEWSRLRHFVVIFVQHIIHDQCAVCLAIEAMVGDGVGANICFCSEEVIASLKIVAVEIVGNRAIDKVGGRTWSNSSRFIDFELCSLIDLLLIVAVNDMIEVSWITKYGILVRFRGSSGPYPAVLDVSVATIGNASASE